MKIIDLVQNTPEWLKFRELKIGASDAPIIMGVSPWKTPKQLFNEKMLGEKSYYSQAMKHGHATENEALEFWNDLNNLDYQPLMIQSDKIDYMIASLDGYCKDYNDLYPVECPPILEIKCPGEKAIRSAFDGHIPEYYNIQVQHQMYCSDANKAHLIFYNTKCSDLPKYKSFLIQRDDELIKNIIEKEKEFYESMMNFTPPRSKYDQIDSPEWKELAELWLKAKDKLETLKQTEEELRKQLIQLSKEKECEGNGIRLSKIERLGAVQYKQIPGILDHDLDKFRAPKTLYWKIQKINN